MRSRGPWSVVRGPLSMEEAGGRTERSMVYEWRTQRVPKDCKAASMDGWRSCTTRQGHALHVSKPSLVVITNGGAHASGRLHQTHSPGL